MVKELSLPGPGHTQCPSAFLSRPTLSVSPTPPPPPSPPSHPPFPPGAGGIGGHHTNQSPFLRKCVWSLGLETKPPPLWLGPQEGKGRKSLGEVPRSRITASKGVPSSGLAAACFPEEPPTLPPLQESAAGPPSCCPSLLYCW